MASEWKPQSTGVLKGLNEDENPAALQGGELTQALNVAKRGDLIGTRPGLVRPGAGEDYETALDEPTPIQGMWEYRKNFDEGRVLIAVAEHVASGEPIAYQDNARLPAGPTITGGQDFIWTFAEHNNLLFGAGGDVADDFWSWNGNTAVAPAAIALVDSAAAALRPKFVIAWRDYVLINGLRGGVLPDNNPSTTRYASFASDPTLPASWLAGNTVGFGAFGGGARVGLHYGTDFTTGFGTYRDSEGDWLILLGDKVLYSVQLDPSVDFRITDAIGNGCVHQRAFVSLGIDAGDAVYMSRFGIHSLRQSQAFGAKEDKFLSWKIRQTMKTLNPARLDKTVGAYDAQNGLIVFAVSTGSNIAHDTLLVLNTKGPGLLTAENAEWYIWKISGANINEMKYARDATGHWHLYAGTTTGDVVRFDNDVFSDLGMSYSAQLVTHHNDYGSTLARKTLGPVMVTLQPGGSYQPIMRFHFDYGAKVSPARALKMQMSAGSLLGTGLLGSFILSSGDVVRDERVDGRGSGRTIAFDVSHTGIDEPFWVGKIDHLVAIHGLEEGDAAA